MNELREVDVSAPPSRESDADRPQPAPRRPQRRTLKKSEVIARDIVHDIVIQDLKPGDRLPPESEMLRDYAVGRASFREALRILEVHGLVTIKPGPGGGPVVGRVRPRDVGRMLALHLHFEGATVAELLEARRLMESALAAIAAQSEDEEELERLASSIEFGDSADLSDEAQYRRAVADFHGSVTRLSGNRVLILIAEALTEMLVLRIKPLLESGEGRELMHAEHKQIAAAIEAHDFERSRTTMLEHLKRGDELMTRYVPGLLDERIDWE